MNFLDDKVVSCGDDSEQESSKGFCMNSCSKDYFKLNLRNLNDRFDKRLRPYLQERELDEPSSFELRIIGSGPASAWPQILFFTVYGIGLAFLFDFVIEEEIPEAFDLPFSNVVSSAFFIIGFFLSAKLFGSLGKYATGVNVFFNSADAIGTSWLHIQAQVNRFPLTKCIQVPRYPKPSPVMIANGNLRAENHIQIKNVQQIKLIEELQDIWRAMIFALKWQFRTNATSSRFDTSVSSDVNLMSTSVDPLKLPMAVHLQHELLHYESDFITGLLDMASYRYTMLIQSGAFQEEFSATVVHVNAVGTQVAIMSALQTLGLPPPVTDLLYISLIVVFLLLPWSLWEEWRYFMIAVYFFEVVVMMSVWGLSNKIGNPFNRFDESPFIYHDIGELSRGVAQNVDDQADKLIAEILALHKCNHEKSLMEGMKESREETPSVNEGPVIGRRMTSRYTSNNLKYEEQNDIDRF